MLIVGRIGTAVYASKDFVEGFASKFRPLLMTQEVKLLQAAPWGPHPRAKFHSMEARQRTPVMRLASTPRREAQPTEHFAARAHGTRLPFESAL